MHKMDIWSSTYTMFSMQVAASPLGTAMDSLL